MLTIENDKYSAQINELGAELTHLVVKATGKDLIWNDPDQKFWKRHAPILFPSIGKSNDDQYVVNGKTYSLGQHGFARDYTFEAVQKFGSAKVTLTQRATAETKAKFPFDYALSVTYALTDNGLAIRFNVQNNDQEAMPFALGLHPGLNIDSDLSDYELVLAGNDKPVASYGIDPAPFRDGSVAPLAQAQGQVVPLSYDFLDDGLVILDAHGVKSATLRRKDGQSAIKVNVADFPYVTLWSPEKKHAPFVCVEAFAGLPDQAGKPVDWAKKLGNNILQPGDHKEFHVDIDPE